MKIIKWLKSLIKKNNYSIEEVYTPTSAAKINYVSRPEIEGTIRRAIKIPGMQIILYGHSGGGKTTIIRKILETERRNYIITSCVDGTTVNSIIINAFDKLNPYYTQEVNKKNIYKISSALKTSYATILSSISTEVVEEVEQKQVRVLPVQLTYEKLGEFLGAAECIWVIEDFHKVAKEEKKKLSDIMKAFVDIANDYKYTKIFAIGAVATPREVVNYTPDIKSRIAEINIPLLRKQELEKIVINGASLLNIEFDQKLIEKTIYYSNFLGSLCHQLCYTHCEQQNVLKTQPKKIKIDNNILKKSIEIYVQQKSDTFQKILDKALKQRKGKFENVKLILNAFIALEKEEVSYNEILQKIKEWEPEYPQGNLTVYLKPLTTPSNSEIIRYDVNSGKYSFSDPFFKAYCTMALEKIQTCDIKIENIQIRISEIFKFLDKNLK